MKALATGLGLALALATAAPAKDPDPLSLPLSPGSVALLIERASEPAVQERWAAALKDPNPQTRAAAARVAGAAGVHALAPAIRDALLLDMDGDALAEEAWALSALDPATDPTVIEAISRLSETQRLETLVGFVRGSTSRFLDHIPKLRSLGLSAREWGVLLEELESAAPTQFARVAPIALRDNDEVLWLALLRVAMSRASGDPGPLQVAVAQSPSAAIRTATCFAVAHGIASGRPVALSLQGALPAASPLETFARELLNRFLGHPPAVLPATTFVAIGERRDELRRWAGGHVLAELAQKLDDAERNALATALGTTAQRLAYKPSPGDHGAPGQPMDKAKGTGVALSQPPVATRTAGPFPPGFVTGVLSTNGCNSDSRRVALAMTRFGANGRAVTTDLRILPDSRGCGRAARNLLLSSVRARGDTAEAFIVLPLEKEFLGCLAKAPAGNQPDSAAVEEPADPFDDASALEMPKLVREIRPFYPNDAFWQRAEGVVTVEVLISASGCVQSLKLLEGVHPSLNTAAFLATSRWAFSPALRNGRPVAMSAQAKVSFKIK